MKSVRPERLNTTYACPLCGGFLAVFGDKRNGEWRCTGCDNFYTRSMLVDDGLKLYVVKYGELVNLNEYIKRKGADRG